VGKTVELGERKYNRIEFQKDAFVILEPGGPWIECAIMDISDGGACLIVGDLPVPKIFVLVMTADGRVRRACLTAWRRGEFLGARFVTAEQLRQGIGEPGYVDPKLQKRTAG
jgi:PilZ domain-containing protein